jgi:single-strand DNA-binding protein
MMTVMDNRAGEQTRRQVPAVHRNEVLLTGRVSACPQVRELPSGDVLMTFRLIVDRDPPIAGKKPHRRQVDTIDCAVWTARAQRTVRSWQPDDVVEIHGALRRRFRRTPGGPISRVEVEVHKARRRR